MKILNKFLSLFIFIITTFNLTAYSHSFEKLNDSIFKTKVLNGSISESVSQTVYVCTGEYAYSYHSRSNCSGMNNCKGQIKYTDENYAVRSLGRKPCCICWSNVSSRCTNDSGYYGSSGGGGGSQDEAIAYAAIAIVALSAIILSNDIYLNSIYSFDKNHNDLGYSFGFRKTFKNSALEYGVSILKNDYQIYNNYYSYNYTDTSTETLFNFNYIHHIFKNKTPHWLTPYVGPSLNFSDDFGYGIVLGSKMKLFDRLDFNLRYELTTLSNQLQAGIIFTYQKKYFWK